MVPTLNRIQKLSRFIDCLPRQTYKDFHLYIVDSGSIDGTKEEIFSFSVPFTLINANKDDWWSAATNLGVKRAFADGCEYILTINDDAIILDDYLEKFMELFLRNNLQFCGNRIDFADSPGQVWALGSYSTFGSPFLFQLKYNDYWVDELPDEVKNKEIIPAMTLCGDGVLIHKSVFEKIGYFEETFTPHAHGDSEFSMRAHKNGIPVYVAPNIVLYNDVYNISEKNLPIVDNRTFYRRLKDVFFSKKSDCYWRPVFYVAFKYISIKLIFPTLLKFFLFKFYLFFFQDFAKIFATYSQKTEGIKFNAKVNNLIKKTARKILRRIGEWVFDIKKYDQNTYEHIMYDKYQTKSLEKIRIMIRHF